MKKILLLISFLFLTGCASSMQVFNKVDSYNQVRFKEFASHVPDYLQEIHIMDSNKSWYENKLSFANIETTKQIYTYLDYSFLQTFGKKSLPEKKGFVNIEQKVSRTDVKTSANFFSFSENGYKYKAEIIARLNWDSDKKKDTLLYFEEYTDKNKILNSYYLIINDLTKPIMPKVISKKSAFSKKYTVYQVSTKKKNLVNVYDIGEVEVVEKPKALPSESAKDSNVKKLSE